MREPGLPAVPPRADHGKQVARAALRPRRQADRLRQAHRSAAARPDGTNISHLIDDVVDELGSREEIELHPHASSKRAPAPTASCACFSETGDLKKVVDYIIQETEAGIVLSNRQRKRHETRNAAAALESDGLRSGVVAGRAQCGERLPAHPAGRKGDRHHRRGLPEIAASIVHELEQRRTAPTTPSCSKISPRARWSTCPPPSSTIWKPARSASSPCRRRRTNCKTRMQMTDVVNRRKIRHAHMVNIEPQIMLRRHARRFPRSGRTQPARSGRSPRAANAIRATTAAGTDITARHESRITSGSRPAASSAPRSGAICRAAKSSPLPAK